MKESRMIVVNNDLNTRTYDLIGVSPLPIELTKISRSKKLGPCQKYLKALKK